MKEGAAAAAAPVVVRDGMEMRGGKGGLEGRKERNAFSSELRVDYISSLICPLWFFSQICSRAAPGVAPRVYFCMCVCVSDYMFEPLQNTKNTFI